MIDDHVIRRPAILNSLTQDAASLGFDASSEPRTGALLQILAASKPGGRLLELGTGVGVATSWLLAGMNAEARLDTVDSDTAVSAVASGRLGADPRVRFHVADAETWLYDYEGPPFDLIFADAWPGKFVAREAALELLAPGGLYVIDDLSPQQNWDPGHGERIEPLVTEIEHTSGLACVRLDWSTGLLIAVKS